MYINNQQVMYNMLFIMIYLISVMYNMLFIMIYLISVMYEHNIEKKITQHAKKIETRATV